jgi:FkbM family methyltransferase
MIVSYAQNFEDVVLWRALGHVEQGFYIDVGAHDPIVDSVSRAFYERGWRGVHVEPSPAFAQALRESRPDETVIEAVVGGQRGVVAFHEIPDTGLSTLDAGIAARHAAAGYQARETQVLSITLDDLLEQHGSQDVHWLKIDVEGAERAVLASWSASAVRPWVVVVESTSPMTELDTATAWEPLLLRHGYEFAWFDGLNRFYVAPGHRDLKPRLAVPPNVFDRFALSGTASSSFAGAMRGKLEQARAWLDEARTSHDAARQELSQHVDAERARAERADIAARDFANRLIAAEQKIGQLERELTDRKATLLHTQQSLAAIEARAVAAEAAFRHIESSRSWRLMAPLRHLAGACRSALRFARQPAAAGTRLPRRLARTGALRALDYLRADPVRKQRLRRWTDRMGPLGARLRRFAAAHPPDVYERARAPSVRRPVVAPPAEPDSATMGHAADFEAALRDRAARWRLGARRNG